ncbi:MAG TPA: response regulator [Phycisphaerae bacterium]|nr:response regulator [Phycisphaerae bacterium]HRY66898.1 response regulator [Phycisphaerae bacterium]HSA26957.1 response regulator [Phycisphaerae bacterium]
MAVILVAEDDVHILHVVALWLKRNGHQVSEARNGSDALHRLRAGGIDLLVSDINMPGMSGIELLQAGKAEGLLPNGAILLSSRCDQKEIADAIRTNGGVVHPKPFSPSRLIQVIEDKLAVVAGPASARG